MIQSIKEDIIKVLVRAIDILEIKEEKDILELKDLSNHTIHSASIFQDQDSISIAVIIFAIYKLAERPAKLDPLIYSSIFIQLKKALKSLKKGDVKDYKAIIRQMFKFISKFDEKIQFYIEEVLNKAKIQKGSKLVEHGISTARTAELLGLSQWELLSYLGKTKIIDLEKHETNIRERLNFARSLFK